MKPQLSLGPVFFNWDPETWRDFYFRIADEAPIDTVYIGEIVCSKRSPFLLPYIEPVAHRLRQAGKCPVISTLALIGSEHEAASMRELVAQSDLCVEINDVGLIPAVSGWEHHLGPFINIYNEATLAYLAARGARLACLPPELPAASLMSLAADAPIALEVFAFGRLPLAISARCFHARAQHLHKDGCRFVCGRDPNGLAITTLWKEPFLAINGTQTLSYTCCNLIGDLERLSGAGIRHFRLSPLAIDMVAVARVFRDALEARLDPSEAVTRISALVGDFVFSNGFFRGKEGRSFEPPGVDVA